MKLSTGSEKIRNVSTAAHDRIAQTLKVSIHPDKTEWHFCFIPHLKF